MYGGYIVCGTIFYSESFILLLLQYSQKEDKYEEEIKILTDKLKEVSWGKGPKILRGIEGISVDLG